MKKREKIKNSKGITLITLVITVVVMLMLAGVAISAIVGEEGLFSKTRQATDIYENAMKNENSEIQNLIKQLDKESPSVPIVEWRYKRGIYTNNVFINSIKDISYYDKRDETSIYETNSDSPEIELLNLNGLKGINKVRFYLLYISDDINYKIYYTENKDYDENNCVTGIISKNSTGKTIDIPIGDYKKVKIILGDKSGLKYGFGTIDLVASPNGVSGLIIRNSLKSTDNVGIEKYQYSEDKIDWYDCDSEITYNSNDCWNKIYYYRAVDWAGNVSEATEACTINLDKEEPTIMGSITNVTTTSFNIEAIGSDNKSGIYRYEFYINDFLEKIIETSEKNVTFEAKNKESSTDYKCKVKIYDLVGNCSETEEMIATTY